MRYPQEARESTTGGLSPRPGPLGPARPPQARDGLLPPSPDGRPVPPAAEDLIKHALRRGWYCRTDWHPLVSAEGGDDVRVEIDYDGNDPRRLMFTLEIGRKVAPSERINRRVFDRWLYHLVWSVPPSSTEGGKRRARPCFVTGQSWGRDPQHKNPHAVPSLAEIARVIADHPAPQRDERTM